MLVIKCILEVALNYNLLNNPSSNEIQYFRNDKSNTILLPCASVHIIYYKRNQKIDLKQI